MTKKAQNFEMWAGDTKNLVVTITGSDSAGYSLASASVTWILEETPGSGSLIRKHISGSSSGSGITISTSTLTIDLDPSDTVNLSGTYYHEAEATDISDQVATLFVGTAKIYTSGA